MNPSAGAPGAKTGARRPDSRVRGPRTRAGSRYRRVTGPGSAALHLRKGDPVLARVIDSHPDFDPRAWLLDLPPMDAFGALVFQITGQQLSIQSTRSILGRLQLRFHGRFPTPEELTSLSPAVLRRLGFSRGKAVALLGVARQFRDGRLSDSMLRRLSDTEIEALLTKIKGIGPWTVHGFLIIALNRRDVTLPGDLALRKVIQRTYHLRRLPSQGQVLRIAEAWRPYRSLATGYLFQAAFDPAARASARS
jgi:DNA-3-methyladenine glycosylase II